VLLLFAMLVAGQVWLHVTAERAPHSAIERRGMALRKEIEAIYADRIARRVLKRDSDVTSTVLKYIPIGTTFDDAERILRAAGCEVGFRYAGPVDGRFALEFEEGFFVQLFPRGPLDYSTVEKLSASIIFTPS
jgi:hypothetical protein